MLRSKWLLAILPMGASQPALAAPEAVTGSHGFTVSATATTPVSPASAFQTLVAIDRWWSPAHSYSGDAANLSLEAVAGGCWCERWPLGQVEHGRVLVVIPGRLLRVSAAFGPLQALPVSGILTFDVVAHETGAKLSMTYQVGGPSGLGLEAYAGPVNGVMQEQFQRLVDALALQVPNPAARP